ICIASMIKSISDIEKLQFCNVLFRENENGRISGATIHFRESKETQLKTIQFKSLTD
ncbi:uncharacterized protein BX663DRAFT_426473, partial [Cokeromyces recurvatus]|uniref:uncharacterized protein n=1 Tax=Cokeromyces recurvatus TaxID=90255 RepID=UPI0022203F4C